MIGHADDRKSTQYSAFKNHKLQEQGKKLNKKGVYSQFLIVQKNTYILIIA